ncbi:MAG: hypothetical protein SPJ89_03340 [Treponema sp.]|nr:hypothetical protein [Treponema sp.]
MVKKCKLISADKGFNRIQELDFELITPNIV